MRRKAKERTKRKYLRKKKLDEYRRKILNPSSDTVSLNVLSNVFSPQKLLSNPSLTSLNRETSLTEDSIRKLSEEFLDANESNGVIGSKRDLFMLDRQIQSIESNNSGKIKVTILRSICHFSN